MRKANWVSVVAASLVLQLAGCVDGSEKDGSEGTGADTGLDGQAGADAPADGQAAASAADASVDDTAADRETPGSGDAQGAEDAGSCPQVGGSYAALYFAVSGTCGDIADAQRVPFDGGQNGVNTSIERRVNSSITTEVAFAGCELRMTQTVTDKDGLVLSQIDGRSLTIESEVRITGRVTITRYDDAGEIACVGEYDAEFTKDTAIIGGAAGGEAGGADLGLDPMSWSAMHSSAIENDCSNTVQCMLQQGGQLPEAPIDICVQSTIRLLEGDPDKQERFLANVERCEQFILCEYVDCVVSDAAP